MGRETRKCVICLASEKQLGGFFASFPKDVDRCRMWVKIVGNEDLVYLPVEKLCQTRYVCRDHFGKKDFNAKGNRLKKNAIPKFNIPSKPLSDKLLKDFPFHVASNKYSIPVGSIRIELEPATIEVTCKSIGLKIALLQLAGGPDKAKNVANAVKEIHSVKSQGAQLVVLPECFNSPYGTKYFAEYAEEVPSGATCRALSKAAAEAGVCVVGGTVPERCGDKLYNTCTVWDRTGKLLAQYRKMHLFDIDIPNKITFKESEVLSAGHQISTFEYQGIKIGLGICYDLRFPELARLMANDGCSLLLYPGAFNMTTGPKHWELLGRARATDFQLWVALASPARDASADYVAWGHSTVVDPWGSVTAALGHEPGALLADIDLTTVEEVRNQIPIGSQRRTDIYDTVRK